MARADWQFIPQATLEKQKRGEDAAAWAAHQRKITAQSWADAHTQDFAANLPEYQPAQMPEGPFSDPHLEMQEPLGFDSAKTAGRIEESPVSAQAGGGLFPTSMDEAGRNAVDQGTGQAPDIPPFTPLTAGPFRVMPPNFSKPTQPPKETEEEILSGEPIDAQDFASSLTKAAMNQGTSPAFAEGMPGVRVGTSEGEAAQRALGGVERALGAEGPEATARAAYSGGRVAAEAGPATRKIDATLERMAGTPEQAARLRPEEAHQAGNVNLAAFPEDVRPIIEERMRAPEANEMAGQRRGVLPDAGAARRAAAVAAGTTVEDWLKTRPGRAFTEAEVGALGNAIVDTKRELDALRAERAAKEAEGVTDLNLDAKIAQRALENAALIGVFSGASAEAGRTLRAFSQAIQGSVGGTVRSPAIQKAFRLLGGEDKFKEWVSAYSKLADDDYVGQFKAVQSLTSPTKMEKFLALTAGNIFGVRSVLANVLGGAIETVNRPLTNLAGGDPKAAGLDVVAMGRAMGEALSNAKEAFTTGVQPSRAAEVVAGGKFDSIKPDAFPGRQGIALTPSLRAMSATDEFVRTINQAGGMAVAALDEARRTGKSVAEVVAAAPDSVLEAGVKAGQYTTFGGKAGPIAELILKGRDMAHDPEKSRRVAGLVFHVLAPVVRIPDVIITRGTKMVAEPAMPLARGAARLVKGENVLPTREERGRAVIASAVLYAAWSGAVSGQITGDGPEDPAKKRVWLEAGNQPHSIKVGDRWFDYTNLGPAAVPISLMASAVEAYRDEGRKVDPEYAKEILSRTAKVMLDSSYIRSIADVFKAIGEGRAADVPATVAGNALSRLVPYGSALGDVSRATDPEQKDTKGNPLGPTISRIPVASEMLPEKIGPLGDPVRREQDAVSILSPLRSEKPHEDKTARVLAGLRIGIGNPPEQVKNVTLTDEDKRKYAVESGKRIREGVDRVAASPRWAGLSDQAKRDVIKRVIEAAHDAAGAEVLRGLGRDELRRRQGERQAALAR